MLLLLSCIRRLPKPVPRIESSTGDAQLAAHPDDCQMQGMEKLLRNQFCTLTEFPLYNDLSTPCGQRNNIVSVNSVLFSSQKLTVRRIDVVGSGWHNTL